TQDVPGQATDTGSDRGEGLPKNNEDGKEDKGDPTKEKWGQSGDKIEYAKIRGSSNNRLTP
ncbi:MAG: hypothetical protein L7F78_18545, partial [Syntrophales bacterium LBB04]|nr:hypothetical protein [Syntrophales bacterium LBB04]